MCLSVAKLVNYRVVPVFVTFMLLAGFLSMFIDSITVMLFMAVVTIELARLLKIDPIPLIIAQVAAANIGGSATMAGDPPNIIIGTGLGFTFMDFVVNTGPLAWAGMVLAVGFFYLVFRRSLRPGNGGLNNRDARYPEPGEAIVNRTRFQVSISLLVVVIALLVSHAESGVSVALIGIIAFVLTLLVPKADTVGIIKRIDWRTLLFFVGIFITVGGLEETGFLKIIADFIGNISHGSLPVTVSIILWASAFLSSIIDNIPFAAAMVPVVADLSMASGVSPATMSWALALGADIGGNGTPIGASANVVATAIAEREGYPVSWGRFCKTAYPAMMLVVGLIQVLILVRYF